MDVQKIQHTVEAEMHSPMENLYGRAVSKDMYVSIDQLIDKMEKQLVKLKSKHDRKKGSDSKSIRRMEGEVEE
jgi:putative sigma-54 modulation protein